MLCTIKVCITDTRVDKPTINEAQKIHIFYVNVHDSSDFVKATNKITVPLNHKTDSTAKPHETAPVYSSYPLGLIQHWIYCSCLRTVNLVTFTLL
jgi:hypothetical protein